MCRTDQLGGHAWQCGNCKNTKVAYNSCKNRSCPQCGWVGVQKWVIRTNPKIIERDHFHMIFSIPEELNALWVKDTKVMIQLLFKAVKQTIEEFSDVMPGCLMTLHTWSRTLALHPHIHCLITAGGMNRKGEWKDSGDYLFPILAVSKWFRTRYLMLIRENAAAFGGKSLVNPLIHPLFDKKWNVFISKKYKHGFGVMKYLSNYVKGGPIKNTRLVSYDGKLVTFRYKDHRDNKQKLMTLPKEEFMRRFLQHMIPKSLRILRFTGIYAQKKRIHLPKVSLQIIPQLLAS